MTFPINEIRKQFPALERTYKGKPVVYFDGPGGSQVIEGSIHAMADYMQRGGANLHGSFPTSYETENIISDTRGIVADFLGVSPQEVVFGANMTTLAFSISRALGKNWSEGDEIVVSEIDHHANVDPWITVAQDKGMTVKWLKVYTDHLTLDLDDLESLITEKTKLVAIGLASNAVGTINDVEKVAHYAKSKGALVAVDAVHAAAHIPINRDQLQADILMCSAYKFFGPHIGMAAIQSDIFDELETYRVGKTHEAAPHKLETGTQNHEGIAGIKPAIKFFEGIGNGNSRREKIVSGISKIEVHENKLATKIRAELGRINQVTLYSGDNSIPKTPTIAFTIDNLSSKRFCEILSEEYSIFAAHGEFLACTLSERLGLEKTDGWIRLGLAPYNTDEEVDRFLYAVRTIIDDNDRNTL